MASLGEILRGQREGLGISLEDVSAVTKIRLHFLTAIETDRFESLPKGVARGFIRSYATFLGLNPDHAVEEYRSLLQASPHTSLEITGEDPDRNHGEQAAPETLSGFELDEPADKCPMCGCAEYFPSRRSITEAIHGYGPMARCAQCTRRYALGPGASAFPLSPSHLKQSAQVLAACLILALTIFEGQNLIQRVKGPVRPQGHSSSWQPTTIAAANSPAQLAPPSARQMMTTGPMLAASLSTVPTVAGASAVRGQPRGAVSARSNPASPAAESGKRFTPPRTPPGVTSVAHAKPMAPVSRWYIQVLASLSAPEATAVRSRLQSEGYPALLMNPDQVGEDDHFFRCLVGPYLSRTAAQKSRDQIHRLGLSGFVRELGHLSALESKLTAKKPYR